MPNGWPAIFNPTAGSTPLQDGSSFGTSFAISGTVVASDSYAQNLPRGSPGLTVRNFTSTTNQLATVYGGQYLFWRGNGNGTGGFYAVWDWAITGHSDTDEAALVGLYYRSGALVGTSVPSALLNAVFAGFDPLESVYKLCANGASGTASCVSCGANFPGGITAPVTAAYRLILYAAPSDLYVTAELRRLDAPSTTPCTNKFSASSGKMPNTSMFLIPIFWASTASSVGNVYLRAMRFYGVQF